MTADSRQQLLFPGRWGTSAERHFDLPFGIAAARRREPRPLSDFHPRKGENHERRYLAGSYGAVPAVFEDSLVDAVLATRTDHGR